MGYFKDTLKGVSWMGGLRVVTRVVAFLKIAFLAHILSPTQFGVYGIAALVLALLEILTETGINVFLIQEEGKFKKIVNTAWVVSIARGIVIALVIIILAPFISSFFRSPDSYRILLFMSLVPFIRGFINPAIIKFQKELEFNKEFLFRLVIFFTDAGVAILSAFLTRSASSLVWGLIAGAAVEVVLSFTFIKPTPKLTLDLAKARRVIERGRWVTAYGIFNYLFENVDDIVVGRLMSTAPLGVYQMAYKISSLPITEVADVFGKVTFPIYVKLSYDYQRIKKAYLKTMGVVSFLVLPFGLIFLLFPKEIVMLILGAKWLDVVPVLRVLALFGAVRAIVNSGCTLFVATKKQEYVSATTLAGILGLGATIVPLVKKYGILGAGYSALFGTLVSIPVFVYYLRKVFVYLNEKDKS